MWVTVDINHRYEVNELGQVRHKERKHILTPKTDRYGYQVVCMSSGNRLKPQNATVHRIVAAAFIPNPSGLPQVNHKDENKSNNAASNLEWCDLLYNTRYGTGQERSRAARRKRVEAISEGSVVLRFESSSSAAEYLGVKRESIRDAVLGRSHTCCGYTWRYAE